MADYSNEQLYKEFVDEHGFEKGSLSSVLIRNFDTREARVQFYSDDLVELTVTDKLTGNNLFYLHFKKNDDYSREAHVRAFLNYLDIEDKSGKKIKVLLTCSCGLTTSYLAHHLEEEARNMGMSLEARAVSLDHVAENINDYDLLLLAPQVGYMHDKLVAQYGAKVHHFDIMEYATRNFSTVIDRIKRHVDEYSEEKTNRHFVLSDLHGNYKVFEKMLDHIGFNDHDHLYILGDCCDRGPDSMKIYDYIWNHKDQVTLLRGNHELMMRDAFRSKDPASAAWRMWSQNGYQQTLESIDEYLESHPMDKEEFYARMADYVDECPLVVQLKVRGEDFVLLHAGINMEKTLEDQNEEELCWMREWFYLSPGLADKQIIFGHTPTSFLHSEGGFNIWRDTVFKDKVGIDGGLGVFDRGQLNCICLEDQKVYVVTKKECE